MRFWAMGSASSTRRALVAVAGLAVAGTALVAPTAAASGSAAPGAAASGAAVGPAAAQPREVVYAALGDSYASGEANPPFDTSAPACDRSPLAWPQLAGTQLGWRTTNLACSGAKTTDVVNPYKGQPAQTASLAALQPRPDVVSVTIGGNDAGFAPVLGQCVLDDCVAKGGIAVARTTIVTALPSRLTSTYAAVRAAAPGARLVVVGYPRLFPARQDDVVGCPWLSSRERRALNRTADLLNLVTRFEAWRAGARFVDVSSTLRGHELCSADSWIFPIGGGPVPAFYAHPILPGQQAIADRVAGELADLQVRR